jgi:hypothetical protein
LELLGGSGGVTSPSTAVGGIQVTDLTSPPGATRPLTNSVFDISSDTTLLERWSGF